MTGTNGIKHTWHGRDVRNATSCSAYVFSLITLAAYSKRGTSVTDDGWQRRTSRDVTIPIVIPRRKCNTVTKPRNQWREFILVMLLAVGGWFGITSIATAAEYKVMDLRRVGAIGCKNTEPVKSRIPAELHLQVGECFYILDDMGRMKGEPGLKVSSSGAALSRMPGNSGCSAFGILIDGFEAKQAGTADVCLEWIGSRNRDSKCLKVFVESQGSKRGKITEQASPADQAALLSCMATVAEKRASNYYMPNQDTSQPVVVRRSTTELGVLAKKAGALFGEKSRELAIIYRTLAGMHRALGQNRQAVDYAEREIGILRSFPGYEAETDLLIAYYNAAAGLTDLGEKQMASAKLAEAIRIVEEQNKRSGDNGHLGSDLGRLAHEYFSACKKVSDDRRKITRPILLRAIDYMRPGAPLYSEECAGAYIDLAKIDLEINDRTNLSKNVNEAITLTIQRLETWPGGTTGESLHRAVAEALRHCAASCCTNPFNHRLGHIFFGQARVRLARRYGENDPSLQDLDEAYNSAKWEWQDYDTRVSSRK